jgi:hypothetical protein
VQRSTAHLVNFFSPCLAFLVLPARPGGSRCPGGLRRRGIRARWLLSVAVIAVTGAVKAVTGAVTAVTRGRDPGLNVSGTVLAVTAMAGG